MSATNRQIRLASRPVGEVKPADGKHRSGPVEEPGGRHLQPDLVLRGVAEGQTSNAVDLSSGNGELSVRRCGEGSRFVVADAFGEAVLEAADHAIEKVAPGGGVAASVVAPPVVVGLGRRPSGGPRLAAKPRLAKASRTVTAVYRLWSEQLSLVTEHGVDLDAAAMW
jgi:hypothetical protein